MTSEAADEIRPLFASMLETYSHAGDSVTRTIEVGSIQAAATLVDHAVVSELDPFKRWWINDIRRQNPHPYVESRRRLRVVDLFSSVGGLSLGVEEAARALGFGVEHLLAVDVDSDALQVYRHNRGGSPVLHGSVRQLVESRVRGEGDNARFSFRPEPASAELEKLVGKVDIVVAGPPCQGHSTLNNYSRGDDPRNGLYLTVPAVAIALDAPFVLIENVPNVVHDRLGVVAAARRLLTDAGYTVADGVLASDKIGWGQTRKRFFLLASKVGRPISPAEIIGLCSRAPMSLRDLIGDLIDSHDSADIFNSTPTLSPANQERIRHLFETESHNLPNDLRPECHKSGTTYKAVYGRMYWDRPAPTITSGFLTPGRGRFVHPLRPRVLTPHEAARVQGFPDWFKFAAPGTDITRTMLTKWIGDAVPPVLGYYAALGLLGDFK